MLLLMDRALSGIYDYYSRKNVVVNVTAAMHEKKMKLVDMRPVQQQSKDALANVKATLYKDALADIDLSPTEEFLREREFKDPKQDLPKLQVSFNNYSRAHSRLTLEITSFNSETRLC